MSRDIKLEMAYSTISRLERKLSDAREILIQSSPRKIGNDVAISKDAYNKLVSVINVE